MVKMNLYLYWSLILLFLSFMSFFFFILFVLQNYSVFLEWNFFMLNSFSFYYIILIDWISLLFLSVVLFISSMVVLYSMNYMGLYSYSSNRFLFLVILFVFSMMLMIISPNLLSILLGWDGLGMVSYCLVIYYNSMKSYLAGMITCLINRLGDIGLLICLTWMMSYGSWHFIFYLNFFDNYLFYLLIISSFTKSAQIPFSSWLPAAMAAPTPVSSLVHSSTLVTAGVYLLIRFFKEMCFNNFIFILLSMLTMLMSSFCANYEFDLKKIIALSTLSQLGLMMSSLFLGMVNLTFFHLLTHAMFKSLLFLCAGVFIYYMNDNQDIRVINFVCNSFPFTTACFNISNLALCGIPFLSGFYSKDMILEFSMMNSEMFLFSLIFYICLGLTCSYSVRLFYYSMIMNTKFNSFNLFFEEKKMMKLSIFMLSLFSIFFGCVVLWLILIDLMICIFPLLIKIMPLIIIILGGYLGFIINELNRVNLMMNYYLFSDMWLMYSYSYYFYFFFFTFSNNFKKMIMWGEYYGPMGISLYLFKSSNFLQYFFNNNLKILFISFLIWLIFII
uniref:NADH dehydrogenase subunit 5 n=1 Tax=Ossuaria sichuanensis TaxID=3060451 RepID=UPI00286B5370|nr:NADH dehydrogenase subunit 5 [Ossuaria sichuanensis]WKW96224.1 NADH dehydrogenase subunit 5 [Ossuaria sichuanensis]